MKEVYLQFEESDVGPFQTVKVEHKETAIPSRGQRVTGYGAELPTRYMVKWSGRWYRVKVSRWGNAGSAYIGRPRAWLAIVSEG